MLHMPTSEIIAKICKKSDVSEDKVKELIKNKIKDLDSLVSEEGAAHIVANDLGIKLFEKQISGATIKVTDIVQGMKNVDVVGKVVRVFEPRKFTKDGRENKVGNFVLADETGSIRMVLWDSHRIEWLENETIKEGTVLRVKNGYVRKNQYTGIEVHIGLRGQIILDVDVDIDVKVEKREDSVGVVEKATISNAIAGGTYQLSGTVVAAFNPNFYDICPDCGKKVQSSGDKYTCGEHGDVKPKAAMVTNVVLDDGTENIRCAAFRQVAESMLGKEAKELKGLSSEEVSIIVNEALLGIELEVEGAVRENAMFGRTELMINKASKVDPKKIVKSGGADGI